ncbi:MAG: hypothetical protein FRX49_03290 [Trebouxia sp. A1-2]|nr:MAG: hypothetical protein FRX49_03290 [Trebouxia sp. A1-2]
MIGTSPSLAYLKALRVAGHGSEQREGGHMGGGLYLVSFEGFSKGERSCCVHFLAPNEDLCTAGCWFSFWGL